MCYRYYDRKSFLCFALGDEKTFIIVQDKEQFISIEIFTFDGNGTSVCVFDDIKTLVKELTWHDWIVDGIIDDNLKSMVNKTNKKG